MILPPKVGKFWQGGVVGDLQGIISRVSYLQKLGIVGELVKVQHDEALTGRSQVWQAELLCKQPPFQ